MTEEKNNKHKISRREFLMRAGATGAVIAGASFAAVKMYEPNHYLPGFEVEPGLQLPNFALADKDAGTTLAIVHGQDTEKVVAAAIAELGGIERFIKPGDVVIIKPNVAFDRPASLAATTHPDTLAALARLIRGAGAKKIMVADNPINSPSGCFLKSGIQKVANELDLELVLPDQRQFAPLQIEGEVLRRWTFFHKPFERADKVIGLAPCKDHNLCSASMTMKNWYGLLGGRRNQFHQRIHGIVSDFPLMVKPTLVVLDGMRVLMSNGPTGGRLSDVKPMHTIVAGTDMVAVDSYGYQHLLERDLAKLEYIHKAHDRGLGTKFWKDTKWKEVQTG